MFRLIDSRRDVVKSDDAGSDATGTYADGLCPITLCRDGAEAVDLRMRSSYGRDLMAAHRLADQALVIH